MQSCTLWLSDCSCYKAQCNHTEETCMRRHVVMINQSRVRRARENWCRPTWDCQGSGVRWVQALSALRAGELSGDSADWLTNQPTVSSSMPTNLCFLILLSDSLFLFSRQVRRTSLPICTRIHIVFYSSAYHWPNTFTLQTQNSLLRFEARFKKIDKRLSV